MTKSDKWFLTAAILIGLLFVLQTVREIMEGTIYLGS